MNTIVSLFKKQQLNSNYNTFINRIVIREFFERLVENHNLNDCGVEIIENWFKLL